MVLVDAGSFPEFNVDIGKITPAMRSAVSV
jgi:hypothetical protein